MIRDDIKKNSTGNEYIFLYSNEFLFYIQSALLDDTSATDNYGRNSRRQLAARIHRLQQDLEDQEIWSKLPSSTVHPSRSTLMTQAVMSLRLIGQRSLANRLVGSSVSATTTIVRQLIDSLLEIMAFNSLNAGLLTKLDDYYSLRYTIFLDIVLIFLSLSQ
jgi:hypothetical protein